LKQRISLRCTLDPLTLSETKEYVRTRLEIAGLPNQQIFSDSSIAETYRCSGGIPRLINTICDNALLTGYACDSKTIGIEIIREVSEDLELSETYRHSIRKAPSSRQMGLPRNGGDIGGDRDEPAAFAGPPKDPADSESFDLFVQFVDKLRDRSI